MITDVQLALLLAGIVAGLCAAFINAAVGSGTLAAFPILLAFGLTPQETVMALTVGLVPGTVAGTVGYRRELASLGRRVWTFVPVSAVGGAVGAYLLFSVPRASFDAAVPWLLAASCLLLLIQPRLQRLHRDSPLRVPAWVVHLIFLALGVYGALLGAGQGILALAVLAVIGARFQVANGMKNLACAVTNIISATILVATVDFNWLLIGCIAVGAVVGGSLGSRLARRLPDVVFRILVVLVTIATLVKLATS